jgi:quercetin dioxygenase-like cupin family protein
LRETSIYGTFLLHISQEIHMKMPRFVVGLGALAAVLLVGPTLQGVQQDENGFVRVTPDRVNWVNDTDGVQRATILGDPTKPGLYVIRVKFPPGIMSRNHYHPEDRYAVVLKGTWYTGTGSEFAPDKTVPLVEGSFMKHPAGQNHFDGAKDQEVILQIVGMGPSQTIRLRPQEGNYGPSLRK